MRHYLSIAAVVAFFALSTQITDAGGSFSKGGCSFGGTRLYGKVKEVSSFPDVKVKVVTSFPDLKVQEVSSFPDKCGKWKMVKSGQDFTIKFVDSFPDVKIKYVTSFPGT